MQAERVTRAVLFAVFFSVGAAVLAGTVLCDDLLEYLQNRGLLKLAEEHQEKLEALNADYDVLLGQLEGDPNQLARLAPATLGIEPNEPNTAYPHATADKLAAARQALIEEPNQAAEAEPVPPWLELGCQWPRRHILFFCGGALVLVSFVFFGPIRKPARSIPVTSSRPESVQPPETK